MVVFTSLCKFSKSEAAARSTEVAKQSRDLESRLERVDFEETMGCHTLVYGVKFQRACV